jgi:hypothetical protein
MHMIKTREGDTVCHLKHRLYLGFCQWMAGTWQ